MLIFVSSVAFCIIFYLTCTAPSLWIIHVETANRKLYHLAKNKLNANTVTSSIQQNYFSKNSLSSFNSLRQRFVLPTTTPLILSIKRIECYDKVRNVENKNKISCFYLSYLGLVLYRGTTLA